MGQEQLGSLSAKEIEDQICVLGRIPEKLIYVMKRASIPIPNHSSMNTPFNSPKKNWAEPFVNTSLFCGSNTEIDIFCLFFVEISLNQALLHFGSTELDK